MPADVAGPRKILALLGCAMTTSGTFEPVLPLGLRKIFVAVEIRFEAVGELYHVLALENLHKIPIFIDFKDMQLSTDLYALKYTIQQSNFDCEVLVCDGAQEGLGILFNLLKAGKDLPDYIFLDLDMPELDGWDFLDRYRAIGDTANRTKVFILSTFTSSLDRDRAKHHSMVEGFYDKPLSRNSVNQILKSRLD